MSTHGLQPHTNKTVIVPPGGKKIVLGLLVDGDRVRLTKEFKNKMECHIHYLMKLGPEKHANTRGFDSILAMRRHLYGLASFAVSVNEEYGKSIREQLDTVQWPL